MVSIKPSALGFAKPEALGCFSAKIMHCERVRVSKALGRDSPEEGRSWPNRTLVHMGKVRHCGK